jgi:hypothetical protein
VRDEAAGQFLHLFTDAARASVWEVIVNGGGHGGCRGQPITVPAMVVDGDLEDRFYF